MAVTRDEAKLYLRIDNDVEDALIDNLIQSSTTTVENVLPLSDYTTLPENIKTSILYGVAYLYENRDTADFDAMIKLMRAMLFSYRDEVF